MGLFENPYANVEYMQKVTNCAAHKALALESAEKSMVLLKNDKNILPLDSNKIRTETTRKRNWKNFSRGF